ncbi:heme ABC exporter ATP-binding protein CcmA [uncultured Litoreibacter sp.]|uniref:heme ABC exporter ATP-binding protein CcmA n=1 Tax=uncultured Litoreibacter sp. TaxID=1392394 RepID=UPI002630342D|nr:heme ABC exporter ATP-binding protein CcmA [uncultured Litoreibacter sp.]
MEFSVHDLACRRGDLTVLSGVNLTVRPGTALILRGPNGSGKTTLLRCLAGLTPPVAGSLGFSTDDVAYAAHADGLKAQMTVLETVTFWAQIFGAHDVAAALDAFDLRPLLERRTQNLSAGQKRRLSLARLVLTGRPLWALDEPTVSLDTTAVAQFADAVRGHLAGGGAAVIATHIDLGLAEAETLELSQFRAAQTGAGDPFLDEALS